MFSVSISVESNKFFGEFIADSYFFEPSKYEYALYLYRDDIKIKRQSFSERMDVIFKSEDMSGNFYIRVLVRDIIHRNIRAYNSEIISIVN